MPSGLLCVSNLCETAGVARLRLTFRGRSKIQYSALAVSGAQKVAASSRCEDRRAAYMGWRVSAPVLRLPISIAAPAKVLDGDASLGGSTGECLQKVLMRGVGSGWSHSRHHRQTPEFRLATWSAPGACRRRLREPPRRPPSSVLRVPPIVGLRRLGRAVATDESLSRHQESIAATLTGPRELIHLVRESFIGVQAPA